MRFLFVIVLIIFSSCNRKGIHFNESDLIGKSYKEHVELPDINYSESSVITFNENNIYKRTGIMYVYQEGKYYVENDVLEVHYACGENCNINSSCGIQQYILGENGNLHLIYLRESDGNIENLDDTPFDLELEKLKNDD